MSIEGLNTFSSVPLRLLGFIWLIRGALASTGGDQGRITSSAAMATAFFIAAIGTGGNL